MFDEVVHNCRGPRCIIGDFNCYLMQFPEMESWRALGWQEIQVHAQQLESPLNSLVNKLLFVTLCGARPLLAIQSLSPSPTTGGKRL